MDKLKILIIHQDSEVRKGIFDILAYFNLEFMYAEDGLDGLAAAKYDSPDLIMSGIHLSVLDGISLGRMLKKDDVTKSIPIIYLHDGWDVNYLKEARAINAKAFLIKPYLDNSLIYAVMRAFKKPLTRIAECLTSYEKSLHSRTSIYRYVS